MRMATCWFGALVVVVVLGASGNADAGGPLSTQLLLLDNNQYIRCVVTNVSAKDVVVDKIESISILGEAALLSGPLTLEAGKSEPNLFSFNSGRCVFTVKKSKAVRAYGCVTNLATSLCLTESDAK